MRLLFRCTPAFVKKVTDGVCEFRTDPSGATVKVDLGKRPSTGTSPDQILVDDPREEGGFSDLVLESSASEWHAVGGLYIEHAHGKQLGLPVPPAGPQAYEFSAVYYTPDDTANRAYAGHRYHGFHVRVLERNGQFARCRIWSAGASHVASAKSVETWIDLADPLDCDANATIDRYQWPTGWPRIGLQPPQVGEDAGVLYIETKRAGNRLDLETIGALDIPKLPNYMELPSVPSPQPRPADPGWTFDPHVELPLCVSSNQATATLLEIQQIVAAGGCLALVDDLEGLYALLLRGAVDAQPARVRRRLRRLDLIGHSATTDHLLVLGNTVIDARDDAVIEVFERIAREKLLQSLGIGALGLIGCRTARSDAGRATIAKLREILHVDVQAPGDLVTADEFDATGFTGTMADPSLPPPIMVWPRVDFADGFGMQVLSVNRPAHAEQVYAVRDGEAGFSLAAVRHHLVEPPKRGMSGLLVKARAHVLVAPLNGSPEQASRSFEILLDYRMVRVYPPGSDHAVVYRVADPVGLRHVIEGRRSPIPFPQRIDRAA